VQTCLSIVTAVANGSGPVVSPRTGRRLGSLPRDQQLRNSYRKPMRALASPSGTILVSVPLCF
jgi:hypothetical protein